MTLIGCRFGISTKNGIDSASYLTWHFSLEWFLGTYRPRFPSKSRLSTLISYKTSSLVSRPFPTFLERSLRQKPQSQ